MVLLLLSDPPRQLYRLDGLLPPPRRTVKATVFRMYPNTAEWRIEYFPLKCVLKWTLCNSLDYDI